MQTHALSGVLVAAAGGLTIALGHVLGLDLDQVALLGVALGGVVALVPDRSLPWRTAGFLAGLALAGVGYGVRAAALPDTAAARGIVVFAVVLACLAVSVATMTRVPLWSTLVGAAAMVGAYESAFVASPPDFLAESTTAVTTVLLAAALGCLGASVLGPRARDDHDHDHDHDADRDGGSAAGAAHPTHREETVR